MFDDDIEDEYDLECPECGHSPVRSRNCSNLFCEDGSIDNWEDDPVNYQPGESYSICEECKGTGVERWCPKCGKNLSDHNFKEWEENNE